MIHTLHGKLIAGCLLITILFALGGAFAIHEASKISARTSHFVEDYWETADLLRATRLAVEQISNTALAPPAELDVAGFTAKSRQRLDELEQRFGVTPLAEKDIRVVVALLRQLAERLEEPVRWRDEPADALRRARQAADRLWKVVDPRGSAAQRTALRQAARACSEVVVRHDTGLRGAFLEQIAVLFAQSLINPAIGEPLAAYRERGLALFAADQRLSAGRQAYQQVASALDVELARLGRYFREEVLRPEAATIQARVRRIDQVLLAAIGASVLGALLLGLLLARQIAGPLARTVEMMEDLGRGRLDRRLRLQRRDEIGRMAAAVDRFADTLQENTARMETLLAERSRSEERHRQLSQEFGAVLHAIPDELSLVAPDMRIVWSNRGDEGGGEPGAFHHCSMAVQECPVRRCYASGAQEEGREATPEGRVIEIRAFPLKREGEVTGVVRWSRDVTERVRLQQEADQASRLAALGEVAAGVAHEINNPNGMILLNLGLLADFYRDVEPLLEEIAARQGELELAGLDLATLRQEIPLVLREMQGGARKVKTIVEDLKNFARRAPPRHEERVDLNEVARAAARLTANAIGKAGARFELDLAEQLPEVAGSFQRIEQVVINLLVNACQALEAPGRAIRVTSRHDAARRVNVLEVRDEGRGIAEADLRHIFDPFFTTRREEGGTGLGLSVSERIVREHGGQLELSSRPGGGTTATVTLPAAENKEKEA